MVDESQSSFVEIGSKYIQWDGQVYHLLGSARCVTTNQQLLILRGSTEMIAGTQHWFTSTVTYKKKDDNGTELTLTQNRFEKENKG